MNLVSLYREKSKRKNPLFHEKLISWNIHSHVHQGSAFPPGTRRTMIEAVFSRLNNHELGYLYALMDESKPIKNLAIKTGQGANITIIEGYVLEIESNSHLQDLYSFEHRVLIECALEDIWYTWDIDYSMNTIRGIGFHGNW